MAEMCPGCLSKLAEKDKQHEIWRKEWAKTTAELANTITKKDKRIKELEAKIKTRKECEKCDEGWDAFVRSEKEIAVLKARIAKALELVENRCFVADDCPLGNLKVILKYGL